MFLHFWDSEELQLFRVFDSLEYEDAESDKTESGIRASGDLDAAQTSQLGYLDIIIFLKMHFTKNNSKNELIDLISLIRENAHPRSLLLQALQQGNKDAFGAAKPPAALGNVANQGQGGVQPPPPTQKEPKPKKKPGPKKIVQQKIQACSAKLTDLKCWTTKMNESAL